MAERRYILLDVVFIQRVTARGFVIDTDDDDHVCVPIDAIKCPEAFDTGDANCVISVLESWARKKGLVKE
jgi:hypothetical protein